MTYEEVIDKKIKQAPKSAMGSVCSLNSTKKGTDFTKLYNRVAQMCDRLLLALNIPTEEYLIIYSQDGVSRKNFFYMTKVAKVVYDKWGVKTTENLLAVNLFDGGPNWGKAGKPNEPNCQPEVSVTIHAGFMDVEDQMVVFKQFFQLSERYHVYVSCSTFQSQCWRYPSKVMEAKGVVSKQVVTPVYKITKAKLNKTIVL